VILESQVGGDVALVARQKSPSGASRRRSGGDGSPLVFVEPKRDARSASTRLMVVTRRRAQAQRTDVAYSRRAADQTRAERTDGLMVFTRPNETRGAHRRGSRS
jgi:hypothetical protein